MLLIRKKQFAEELRAMEIGVVCVYGVPREIVLLLRQIAAFVEIPPNRPGRNEVRKEQPQQPEGELVCHVPAVRCPRTRCVQRRGSAGQKDPHPVLPARAEAKVETEIWVQLNIQIPHVMRRGADEKFQTAVLTRLIEHAGMLGADFLFLRVQVHIQPAVVKGELCIRADLPAGLPEAPVDRRPLDFVPVRPSGSPLDPILSGHGVPLPLNPIWV